MSPRFSGLRLAPIVLAAACAIVPSAEAALRVGAAVADVTPTTFPVVVNGNMLPVLTTNVNSRINARALVLDDGRTQLAIAVVDSCMMPRDLLDEAKRMIAEKTGLKPENMLISATHAHSVPASMGCLGSDVDPNYPPVLKAGLVEAVAAAQKHLEPAKAGWAVADAGPYTALRRWIRRPDRMTVDPFGNRTVRANMHPGYLSEDATGPSGPKDPDLSLLAFQALDGRPIAVLGNFSMHYFGAPPLSADYFGLFSEGLKQRLAPDETRGSHPPFVGIMSHGPSGDIYLRDYSKPAPKEKQTIESYTDALLNIAQKAYQAIQYRENLDLAMAQAELPLNYRVPDAQRLQWASNIVAAIKGRGPTNLAEIYAREAILLHEKPRTKLILQAIRIGPLGIATIPCETYALSSLKLKAFSPLQPTVNIELANGAEGYIPPPEQHPLGGYNTWDARTAGLEPQAEPKIVETLLQLLEKVSGKPRREPTPTRGPATVAILKAKPVAYWRLDEFAAPRAVDLLGRYDGIYETGVVFYLEGPQSDQFNRPGEVNRAAHFAGGRMQAQIPLLGTSYSVSLWFWNGMPNDGREVAGYMISRGRDHTLGAPGDHLGVGGKQAHTGQLIFCTGDENGETLGGRTVIPRWTWNHAVLVREGDRVRVYLNGNPVPEIDGRARLTTPSLVDQLFVGGRNDNYANWEGKLDEVAVFDRALSAKEAAKLWVKP